VFPDSFRQLQCYVLVGDVLEVMEKLMLHMPEFRQGFFFHGAAQHFITLHIHTRYKVDGFHAPIRLTISPHFTLPRLPCLRGAWCFLGSCYLGSCYLPVRDLLKQAIQAFSL
jgi:hypothetical protein